MELLEALAKNKPEAEIIAMIDGGADVNYKNPYNGQTPVMAVRDNVTILKKLIEKGADVNAKDEYGSTPLLYAIKFANGNLDILNTLLDAGARIKEYSPAVKSTVLGAAISQGLFEYVKELVKRDPTSVNFLGGEANDPLTIAVVKNYPEVIKLLVDNGANVNFRDSSGFTPFRRAINKNQEKTVELFLEKGADKVSVDEYEYTPLMHGVSRGALDSVRVLLSKGRVDPNVVTPKGCALTIAVFNENLSMVRELFNGYPTNPNIQTPVGTPMVVAAYFNQKADVLQELKRKGADVNLATNTARSETPLLAAINERNAPRVIQLLTYGADPDLQVQGHLPLVDAIEGGNNMIIELLLDKGATVNKADGAGTPLLKAIDMQSIEIVQLLLDKGGDPNYAYPYNGGIAYRKGATPLDKAVYKQDIPIIRALLDKGADVNKPYGNITPLVRAIKDEDGDDPSGIGIKTEIVRLLLDKDADPNLIPEPTSPLPLNEAIIAKLVDVVDMLLEKGADVNKQDSRGFTPLLNAAAIGNAEIVLKLLTKGAEVDKAKPDTQVTPLILAAAGGHDGVIRILVDRGADINKGNSEGNTALITAARARKFNAVVVLLELGADPNKQAGANMTTALMIASRSGNAAMVEALIVKGADKTLKNAAGLTALDVAGNDEVRNLLETSVPFEGIKKSEIDYFDIFLGKAETEEQALANVKKHTFCPVCLGRTETTEGCLYVKHVCPEDKRHPELYAKYKDPETGEISWCSECGRICKKDQHYGFALVIRDIPALKPKGATCEAAGGGGIPEKLKRVVRYVDYAYELEHFVGEISQALARKELVEEVWNAPARRLRYDPLKFKAFKTDTSVFKAGGGRKFEGMYESDNVQCLLPKKSGVRSRKNHRHKKRSRHNK